MNNTTHTHRLYTVLALVAGMLVLAAGPAASTTGGPDNGTSHSETREVDGWIYGRGAATYGDEDTSGSSVSEDGWARGGGLESLTAEKARPLPVDGWAIGQGMRAETTQPQTAVAPEPSTSTTPISLQTIVLGLLIAAVLGGAAAVLAGHRRQVPSAR